MKYADKLLDDRWMVRKEIYYSRNPRRCVVCFKEDNIDLHHKFYDNREPWDYKDGEMESLCRTCHTREHDNMKTVNKELVSFVREKFLNDDIIRITEVFKNIPTRENSGLWDLISSFLTDEKSINVLKSIKLLKNKSFQEGMVLGDDND